MTVVSGRLDELYAARPRSRFLRLSLVAVLLLVGTAWLFGAFHIADVLSSRRLENLLGFLESAHPYELRDSGLSLSGLAMWSGRIMSDRGWMATAMTLGISVSAVVIAGACAIPLSLLAARNVATHDPWSVTSAAGHVNRNTAWSWAWRTVLVFARGFLVTIRSIPEYIWAFLLIAAIGPSAWPAVLALALHNAGILGKLWSETIENIDPAVPTTLRAHGHSRLQVVLFCVVPMALPRMLLYLFYRWETCVREATVLGMLGIASLGLWIKEARARDWYDEMLFFTLLGAVLVVTGDVVSWFLRRQLRNAS